MAKPEVIMHNSVSLDGRVIGFPVDMGLHYGIVGGYGAEVYLAGSNTAKTGIFLGGPEVPVETPADFRKPDREAGLSWWVVPDTRGILKGLLHVLRRFEYCRDVIILVSETTGADYIAHLDERGYDHLLCGRDRVDFGLAFGLLAERYGVKRVLVDSGPTLGGVLLEAGLVDEISLLVHPVFAGAEAPGLFDGLKPGPPAGGWAPVKAETLAGGCVRLIWRAK
jgi:2,5-diamino-6-(ribosylamino)-4(3H)-pyrimidinone 5'-phosphate reductase